MESPLGGSDILILMDYSPVVLFCFPSSKQWKSLFEDEQIKIRKLE
jgi:hypothetical protein